MGEPAAERGWEAVAEEFLASRSPTIGAAAVAAWAESLPRGAAVLDLGCGGGEPLSRVLLDAGLEVFGVDASPSLVAAFQRQFPGVPVACEPVESSSFFERSFDGVLAWGLFFLLAAETQRALFPRIARALRPGGRLLFTAPEPAVGWTDLSTGRPSLSLGLGGYGSALSDSGLVLVERFTDEGENHYFSAVKPS